MNDEELAVWIRELKRRGGMVEVHRETTFLGYREHADGNLETLRITVGDQGPDVPNARYSVTVVSESTGREASGNPGDTVHRVLMGLHWRDLDT